MAAPEAAIQSAHVRAPEDSLFCWMAGSSPAMTNDFTDPLSEIAAFERLVIL
jgi:hypothetical protein